MHTDYDKPSHISIIGGGNLGTAIAQGLIASHYLPATAITVTRRHPEKLRALSEQGVEVISDNVAACLKADLVILAIKPYQIRDVLLQLQQALQERRPLLASVVTGVSLQDMQEVVGKELPLFRIMPNTAISIRESMTCVATQNASPEQLQLVLSLFNQLGVAIAIDEHLMAAATVLGACGIAYALRFIRAASQGGIEIGFSSEVSQLIAAQTVKGAASLLLESGNHPEQEIDKVTTPKGCTIAGLNEMEHRGFSSSLIKGIKTSFGQIDNIAKDFDKGKAQNSCCDLSAQ